jgi:GNAT superfamily N-acetyltransferase
MPMMIDQAEVYVRNAVAMWDAFIPGAHLDQGLLRADREFGTRIILRQPLDAEAIAEIIRTSPTASVVVEDIFGLADTAQATPTTQRLRLRVMNRPPGMIDSALSGVRVVEVGDPETLANAERVMVDGFPFPQFQPWVRGQPGWKVWLAYLGEKAAAAAYTFDDGDATGVYWLATLPAHRSRGLARAVLTTAIAARPDQVFTLVATEAGRPLYESLGFLTVAMATWHTRPAVAGRATA